MKRIVITENQAKKLVSCLVKEQTEPPKESSEVPYEIYKINSTVYAKIGDTELYGAKFDKTEKAWVPDKSYKLATEVKFTVVPDSSGVLRIDIAGGPEYIEDEETRVSLQEGLNQSNNRGGQQPMQTAAEGDDISFGWEQTAVGVTKQKLRMVSLGYGKETDQRTGDEVSSRKRVPIYATIALRISKKQPVNNITGEALEIVEYEEGAQLIAEKTCLRLRKGFLYVHIGESIQGTAMYSPGESEKRDLVAYYCVELNDGSRSVRTWEYSKSEGAPPSPEKFIGRNGIVNVQGPFQTEEDANKNCQKVTLPQLIPLGKYFADNVSIAKLSKSDEGIKSLDAFFAAGGKLTGFRIVASASKVPAGCEEAQTKEVKDKNGKTITTCSTSMWKNVTKYNTSAKGDNDDGTGNLQLTKARAFNLYKQLLNMFPQLEGIPYSLEALGSIGLDYDKAKGDQAGDAKYAQFRKVDFIPTYQKK